MERTPPDAHQLERALAYTDSWLGWWVPRSGVPGVALAVSVGDEVRLSGGYGMADPAAGLAMPADGTFRVASHSKTFTAAAVMQLVEAGRVRLDDPVADHLGKLAGHDDPRWRRVTVRQLLCHGGGVTRDGEACDHWQLGGPFPDHAALEATVFATPLVTDANVAMKYSNVGYGILGALVEELSGEAYADYVGAHLTGPLGLADTTVEATGPVVAAHGTRRPDGTRRRIPDVPSGALAPATGLASTAPDLCRWLASLLPGASPSVLGDESRREMARVQWHVDGLPAGAHADYGLGLLLPRFGTRRTFGHSGGWPGHITLSVADPADGIVVSALTNCIDGPARSVVAGVLGVIDAFLAGGAPADATPARVEGRYLDLWDARDLVPLGDGVRVADPAGWSPMADPDRLEAVEGSADLRIAGTSGFGSPGELVRALEGGAISFAGATMWTEAEWPAHEDELLGGGAGGR